MKLNGNVINYSWKIEGIDIVYSSVCLFEFVPVYIQKVFSCICLMWHLVLKAFKTSCLYELANVIVSPQWKMNVNLTPGNRTKIKLMIMMCSYITSSPLNKRFISVCQPEKFIISRKQMINIKYNSNVCTKCSLLREIDYRICLIKYKWIWVIALTWLS